MVSMVPDRMCILGRLYSSSFIMSQTFAINLSNLLAISTPGNAKLKKVRHSFTIFISDVLNSFTKNRLTVKLSNCKLLFIVFGLTPRTPAVPNCCCSKGSAPYWSNPPFLISDFRALWRSVLSARAPECQKLKMMG